MPRAMDGNTAVAHVAYRLNRVPCPCHAIEMVPEPVAPGE